MIELEWHGLYGDGWKNEIVPDAFTHPAKYSRALIRHIYEYLMQEGYVKVGDTVLDPFGGVALGGLDAMRLGLHWVGVELEPKFVALGTANIALWNKRYADKMPRWGTARLLQGDSRRLRDVIAQAECAVSSPPFCGTLNNGDSRAAHGINSDGTRRGGIVSSIDGYGTTPGNLGNLREGDYKAAISSPPYEEARIGQESGQEHCGRGDQYGQTAGQMGAMKGDGFKAAVASPPYAESLERKGGIDPSQSEYIGGPHSQMNNSDTRYGSSDGQLGAMRGGGYDAAVSSPAFPDGGMGDDRKNGGIKDTGFREGRTGQVSGTHYGSTSGQMREMKAAVSSPPYEGSLKGNSDPEKEARRYAEHTGRSPSRAGMYAYSNYANDSGEQLGNETGDDFWSAAKQVVSETYAVLAPSAVAVWVVKAFVRNKAIVDFPGQWQALCEACGFETVTIAKAWLVEDKGTQIGLDGNHNHKKTERKSFFRRLAESKGSPRIDWETVLIMKKPRVTLEAKQLTDA